MKNPNTIPLCLAIIATLATVGVAIGADSPEAKSSRALVVYFSRAGEQYKVGVVKKGNTSFVADEIVKRTGADVFEIKPKTDKYPAKYDPLTDYAKKEQREKARPEYAGKVPDLSKYDLIFIGAPVWWGDWPMIMYTFFEKNDLSGKTLAPFCTHEGSGLSGLDRKLAKACPKSKVTKGLALTGQNAQKNPKKVASEVSKWLDDLKITKSTAKLSASAREGKYMSETSNSTTTEKETFDRENIFGQGDPNDAYARYFIGNSYLKALMPKESPLQIANVTFEPGCRNNWHIHRATKDGGQILLCTAGEGWYQAEGEAAVEMKPGVSIYIPANVKHWHGAKKDKWFSHIAIGVPGENESTEWLEPVDDALYDSL